ncbi:carboxymuconolactone decarboxylase family protein [Mycolicibacterium vinylchloridicum]|uniref:carboxymuconolactone decarboxylase family protein n=1 Tax=Mycolicibacterium vinylchloridicum TaxID=2736928 RepID=UPI0015C94A93|nr:carboxymuconolactone decarboxylase family protein [Mycolicibacterium vinylchloridicum]
MRLTPLPAEQWDDDVQLALKGMLPRDRQNPEGAGTALSTLVRHPDLTKAYLGFNVYLLFRSTLPARLREVAVLRVAHRRECAYEWEHHVEMAEAEGLTDADVEAIRNGGANDELDRLVVRATDELEDTSNLTDETWAALGEHLSERQRMDFVFTVGAYGMLAMAFNTFGVQLENER